MPNGKHGDHPYTDIMIHGRDVYSKLAAELVREIVALVDERKRNELADMLLNRYNDFDNPNVTELESVLTQMRDEALRSKGSHTEPRA
jgi:hypothetical protein